LLLGLLLPFSLCIADEYISIDNNWDERAQNQWRNPWDEIARNHKTYYFENGLDHFNQGQYKQAFKDFKLAQEYSIGLGSVYLAKMYLEGKGVKVDYKKAQFYAQNAIKGYGSGLLGGALILGRMQAQGLGMKKDLKQALKTYRHVVRMFSNKSTNYFANNFRLPNLAFTSMLIGSRFIDLSGLSANPIKFGKKFGILVMKSTQIKDKTLLWEDIAEISSNIILLKQQMGEILYRIGIAYKEGLGVRKQKNRAKKFLQKSAEFGYEKAMEAL
ncbi:sel1 repeat family protein, partial [Helicobacter pylori]|uniref:tetratricopeptide repeat protein n=1 Tax=Helicobacter pylori TaxID=210 RepID=UPI001005E94C